jgi:tetratricopeptide (TPR) repeat protein
LTSNSAFVQRIELLLSVGRYAQARDLLLDAGVPDAGGADEAFLLASALLSAEDPRAAIRAAEAGLRAEPDDERGYRLRAIALIRLGDLTGAVVSAREAVRLDPQNEFGFQVLSEALVRQGDLDGARAAAQQIIALNPGEALGHRTLGIVETEAARLTLARQHLLDALARDPQDPLAMNALGIAEAGLDQFGSAAERFARAVLLDPSGPGADNHDTVLATAADRRWRSRRSWARIASAVLNPFMGRHTVRFWLMRRRRVPGSETLFGPVLWSGGIWRASARVGLTAIGWFLVGMAIVTAHPWLLVGVTWAFWGALELGARLPVRGRFAPAAASADTRS